nr:hypothetical protein [Tanacetum cinerariifolium]
MKPLPPLRFTDVVAGVCAAAAVTGNSSCRRYMLSYFHKFYCVFCYENLFGSLIVFVMECGYLSQIFEWVMRGVKKKNVNTNKTNTSSGIGVSTEYDDTMNEDTPVGVASIVKEGVTPFVVDMTVEMEKISSLEDSTVLESFPPLPTQGTIAAGNALGKSSYANVTGKPSGKKLNIRTLFTRRVMILMCSIEGLDAMVENGPWFIQSNPLILKKWHPGENLLKEDVRTVSVWVKLHGVPVIAFNDDGLSVIATKLGTPLMLDSYTANMCMQSWEFEGKAITHVMSVLSMSGNLLGVRLVRFLDIFIRNVRRIQVLALKKLSQTSRGVPIGPKIESDSEVEVVFDETANLRISTSGKDESDKGYGTNSLLEQWMDYYPDNDDYDRYDDDMYENHDLSEHLQSICDDLDITVRYRKKK